MAKISTMSLPVAAQAELERRRRRAAGLTTLSPYHQFQERYWADPAAFAAECIAWPAGQGLTPYQAEIMTAVPQQGRAAARSLHGAGKTTTAALLALWFALTRDGRDWKVLTTASAWRQLTAYLWPEIHKWARRLQWAAIGRAPFDERLELLTQRLNLATGQAFAVASNDHTSIEGAHADHLLYILDEAKAIPAATWDAAEGAFASAGECYALAISTPGAPVGRFYEIQARQAGYQDWWVRHITLEEAVAAGRVSSAWVEARRQQWEHKAPALFRARVLGEFTTGTADALIPFWWVEAALDRWRAWAEMGRPLPEQATSVGVDVARSREGDWAVQAWRYDLRGWAARPAGAPKQIVLELDKGRGRDTMEQADAIAAQLDDVGGRAIVDVVGLGAGVYDRLAQRGYDVHEFSAGGATDMTDSSGTLRFADKRSAGWWQIRELLDPENGEDIALPPDDMLIGDLTAPTWEPTTRGRIKVESKDTLAKRLSAQKRGRDEFGAERGPSTDAGDAVVMAFWDDVGVYFG